MATVQRINPFDLGNRAFPVAPPSGQTLNLFTSGRHLRIVNCFHPTVFCMFLLALHSNKTASVATDFNFGSVRNKTCHVCLLISTGLWSSSL